MNETPRIEWENVAVEGATLSGLSNPNRKNQSKPIFDWAISQKKYDTVVFQLGYVDTGFVIHYRAQRDNVDVYKSASKALENYMLLIKSASNKAPVIVTSTCLPTIQDGDYFGSVQNARKDVQASLRDRTDLTLWFNKKIKNWCHDNNIIFINLDKDVLDDNQLLDNRFICESSDHHYKHRPFAHLIIKKFLPHIRKAVWN